MNSREDVCVLIPTLDEAATVGDVIDGFHEQGYENVLVMDGGSTDGTRETAEAHGARVRRQTGSGKGQAVREALGYVDVPYVLMVDGDGTYDSGDADRLVEPLVEGRADHVIGDRFADMRSGAMSRLNQAGNRMVNAAFTWIHGRDLGDILSGYRAFTRESVEGYELSADGFGIETELAVACVKRGTPTEVVPITYRPRPAGSETNLRPFRDGARISLTLFTLAKTNNPLFYFGSVGVASLLTGLGIAGFVGYEWYVRTPPVSHEALAVAAAAGVLLGVQLLMFGVLSDVIVSVNREQTRRLEELTERIEDRRSPGGDRASGGAAAGSPEDARTGADAEGTSDTEAEPRTGASPDPGQSSED